MDQLLKLAQLYKVNEGPNTRKLEIAKEIDIDYSIPDDYKEKQYSGYNCLHIAALKCDGDMVEYFLSRGANFCKKGTFDGSTPVHTVIRSYHTIENRFYWILTGLLQKNELINSLLSGHVKNEIALNPKCNNGQSHFHVACMFNHLQAVEYFLKVGEPVDQVTNAGLRWPQYTPLHFAVRYSSVQVAETLLKHGADANKGDATGLTSLQLAVKRLITISDYMFMGKGFIDSFYEEEVQRIDRLVCLMLTTIQKDGDAMYIDKNGLTSLHLACITKESSFLDRFLQMNCDLNIAVHKNSEYWSGWTPLHFAACISDERFKLLLKHGAKFNVKNVEGETPLDLFMKRFSPKIVHSILSIKPDLMNIMFSDNQTKLGDVILAMNDPDRFDELLKSLKNVDISVPADSPIWPGYTVLHLAISLNNKLKLIRKFDKTFDFPKVNSSPENQVGTEHEETRYWNIIQKCLTRRCKVAVKNAKGDTSIHMAFKLLNKSLVLELLKYCQDDAVNADNLSIFHIACMTKNLALALRLLSKGSDVNLAVKNEFQWCEPELVTIRANSTALHTAVILDNEEICDLLAVSGADFYARDSTGSTPLHLTVPRKAVPQETMSRWHGNMAFIMGKTAKELMASLLFTKLPDFLNWVNEDGLTYVHLAAYANNENALEKLMKRGAKFHVITMFPKRFAGQTPLHLAATLGSAAVVKILIAAGANIHAENHVKKYETPLLYALERLCLDSTRHFVDKVKLKNHQGVGSVDPSGLTLLHLACATMDLDWAMELLKKGADPNAQIRMDFDYDLAGFTPLHVLMTHVHVYARCKPESFQQFVELLLDHGADPTIASKLCGSPVLVANDGHYYGYRRTDLLEWRSMYRLATNTMLRRQRSYVINPMNKSGFSHFHLACVTSIVDVVDEFLHAGVDINQAHGYFEFDAGFTGLHYASQYHCTDTTKLLIRRGADVNVENSYGQTAFSIAISFGFSDMNLLEMFVKYGANINARNIKNETPLICLIESGRLSFEKLRFFLSRGCKIDTMYSRRTTLKLGYIGMALSSVDQADFISTLELLIETCELQERIKNRFNAIHNVASINVGKLTVDGYMHVFLRFIDMGCNIDQQENGHTALNAATLSKNTEAVEALLRLGADINVTDNTQFFEVNFQQMNVTNDPKAIRTVELLAVHVWKTRLVGFNLHQSNEINAEKFHRNRRINPVVESACGDELMKMNVKIVGTGFIPKEFLCRKSLVVEYPMMPLLKKQAIVNFFSDTGFILAQYPEFSGLLLMKYREIQNRMKVWQEAKSSLSFLIPFELPDLCVEAVLKYLNNNEINVFLDNIRILKTTI